MAVQENVAVTIAYAEESTFGTQGAGPGQLIRRVTSSVVPGKDTFQSNEVRPDQQVSDLRHGTRRGGGSIEGELSLDTYNDWMKWALRSTWAAGAVITEATAGLTSLAASGGVWAAGAGSFITAGLKVGDVFRLTNTTLNTGVNFLITALTATTMSTSPAPVDMAADTTFTITVTGNKVTNGILRPSFSMEQLFPTPDFSELYLGARIGGMNCSIQPNGMATISWDIMAQNFQIKTAGDSPVYSSAADAPNTGIFAGPNGRIIVDGEASTIITGIDFNLNNNLSSQPVVGTNYVPDIFYGRSVITGNVSGFVTEADLLQMFDQETEADLIFMLELAEAAPASFIAFNMQRVKLMSPSRTIGAEGGVIAQFPFQALLKSGGAGTAYDEGTLSIQRSSS
jgi:hypothetical protein